jgi:putative peptidoglycan lipid II flippase
MCPVTVILLLLSTPITKVLFQRGEFGLYSTMITSDVLAFMSIGLFSFGSIKILVTVFHALQDTKTPVKVAALCLLINTSLNFILMYPLKVGGIALASAIAGTLDFLILFYILNKRLGGLNSDLFGYFCKVTLASVVSGGLQFVIWYYWMFPNDVVKLCVIISAGFIFYGILCLVLKIEQAESLFRWLKALVRMYGSSNGHSGKS